MNIKKVLLGFSVGVVVVGSSVMLTAEEPIPAPIPLAERVVLVPQDDITSEIKRQVAMFVESEMEEDLEEPKEIKAIPKEPIVKVQTPTRGGVARLTNYAPLDPNAVEGMCYSGDPNQTATGSQVHARTAAVDPKKIPFGTLLRVEGKIYVAADTGGAMRNYSGIHIDLFTSKKVDAYSFGIQEGKYEIVGKVDPLISLAELEKYIKENNLE